MDIAYPNQCYPRMKVWSKKRSWILGIQENAKITVFDHVAFDSSSLTR